MRKVYWLSVTFLILVKSDEDRRRRVVKKDGTVPVMGRITVAGMKSLSTYTKYSIGCAYVGEFLQEHYHVKDIALQELSLSFITDYETFLRTDKRLKIKKSE